MKIASAEAVGSGHIGEAHQSVHQGQLSGMIELESRDALAAWQDSWRSQSFELVAVDKSLQDVLLDIEVVVGDGVHSLTELG